MSNTKYFMNDGKDNGRKIYFMANIKNTSRLYRFIFNTKKKLKVSGEPHITILETEFNNSYHKRKNIYNKEYDSLKKNTIVNPKLSIDSDKIFREIFTKYPMTLSFDKFIIIGRNINIDENFIALKFNIINGNITPYRIELYNIIANTLGIDPLLFKKRTKVLHNNTSYYMFSESDDISKNIFVVPEYYFGNEKWTPHISLCKIGNIKTSHPVLYQMIYNIVDSNISMEKKDEIINCILKTELGIHSTQNLDINFCSDIINISVK
jgi:hypothetical protein